jgi:hypothetical protein
LALFRHPAHLGATLTSSAESLAQFILLKYVVIYCDEQVSWFTRARRQQRNTNGRGLNASMAIGHLRFLLMGRWQELDDWIDAALARRSLSLLPHRRIALLRVRRIAGGMAGYAGYLSGITLGFGVVRLRIAR